MGKKIFLEIALLIIINAIAMNLIKCLHDKFCFLCKSPDNCCK